MGKILELKQLNCRTRDIYEKEFQKFKENFHSLYGIDPEAANPEKIQSYLNSCYPSLIKHSSVFRIHVAAVRKWFSDRHGTLNLKSPRIDPDPLKILSVPQVKKIFASVHSHPCSLMLRLIYESGIRLQEVIKIRIKDVDFEKMTVFVQENESSIVRSSRIPDTIKYDLMRLAHKRDEEEFIFSLRSMKNGSTAPISRRTLQEFLNRISERNGIGRVSIQTLRDSYAIHMIQAGYDLRLIMTQMGLKNIRSMNRYLRYLDSCHTEEPVLRSPLCD